VIEDGKSFGKRTEIKKRSKDNSKPGNLDKTIPILEI